MPTVRQIDVTTEALGPRAWRLGVIGELDLVTAGDVVDDLRRALRHADHIVLDLTGVDFADSTGLAALLRCRRMAGADIVVRALVPCGALAHGPWALRKEASRGADVERAGHHRDRVRQQ